jgi:hypothetical protein
MDWIYAQRSGMGRQGDAMDWIHAQRCGLGADRGKPWTGFMPRYLVWVPTVGCHGRDERPDIWTGCGQGEPVGCVDASSGSLTHNCSIEAGVCLLGMDLFGARSLVRLAAWS